MTQSTATKRTEQAEAIETLREAIKPGDRIYTVLRHVSASGMQRSISPIVIRDGKPWDITFFASRALGIPVDQRRYGLKVNGCGTDMGWEIVYHLGQVLFADGWECTGDHCPSNAHSNGDRDYTPGHMHTGSGAGGYALRQEWI